MPRKNNEIDNEDVMVGSNDTTITDTLTVCLWATHPKLSKAARCTYEGTGKLQRGLCPTHQQSLRQFLTAPVKDSDGEVTENMVPTVPVRDEEGVQVRNKDNSLRYAYNAYQKEIIATRDNDAISKGLIESKSTHAGRGQKFDYSAGFDQIFE